MDRGGHRFDFDVEDAIGIGVGDLYDQEAPEGVTVGVASFLPKDFQVESWGGGWRSGAVLLSGDGVTE